MTDLRVQDEPTRITLLQDAERIRSNRCTVGFWSSFLGAPAGLGPLTIARAKLLL